MTQRLLAASIASMLALLPVPASATDVRVIVSGEVAPGVYGRVEFGSAPRLPVLYAEPMVIVRQPPAVIVQPVYLHVPPGHAKKWSKHCHRYDACSTPVYFVKSAEYEPGYKKKKKHD